MNMKSKKELIDDINKGNAIIAHDETWAYPKQGDDEKTCPLLGFMFKVEYHAGTLVFIPDAKPAHKDKRGEQR